MYQRILIPTDGSEVASKAVAQGLALAKALDASVIVLIALESFQVSYFAVAGDATNLSAAMDGFAQASARHATQVLAEARTAAEAAGVPVETVQGESDRPHEAIIATAEAQRADLIVMGSHGRRGMAALMIGSQTTRVLTSSTIPVLVLR